MTSHTSHDTLYHMTSPLTEIGRAREIQEQRNRRTPGYGPGSQRSRHQRR